MKSLVYEKGYFIVVQRSCWREARKPVRRWMAEERGRNGVSAWRSLA